jgi:hypothetical protein
MAVRFLLYLRSQQRTRQSSPITSASDDDDDDDDDDVTPYPKFLYHNCFVFLLYFVTSVCCFAMKQLLILQKVFHIFCWL